MNQDLLDGTAKLPQIKEEGEDADKTEVGHPQQDLKEESKEEPKQDDKGGDEEGRPNITVDAVEGDNQQKGEEAESPTKVDQKSNDATPQKQTEQSKEPNNE